MLVVYIRFQKLERDTRRMSKMAQYQVGKQLREDVTNYPKITYFNFGQSME